VRRFRSSESPSDAASFHGQVWARSKKGKVTTSTPVRAWQKGGVSNVKFMNRSYGSLSAACHRFDSRKRCHGLPPIRAGASGAK
jgi:hypothetical protein